MDRVLELQSKESMKKTILMQEAAFKQQVQELHRLYNLQKKLMHELEKGLIWQKEPQTGTATVHFEAYSARNDPNQLSSSCSGETSCVPIKFNLDRPSERTHGAEDHRDMKRADEETDVEVELTLGIGRCSRERSSSQCIISTRGSGSDQSIQVAECNSSSMGTSKGEECGDPSSSVSGSSEFRDNKQPHWLLRDLSLNRT